MGSVQTENGYTRIANELLDAVIVAGFSKRQMLVLLAVIRKTYGYNKKSDVISNGQLSKMTNISRRNVIKTLRELTDIGAVTVEKSGQFVCGSETNRIGINKRYQTWGATSVKTDTSVKTTLVSKQSATSVKTVPRLVSQRHPQKTTTKDNTKDSTQTRTLGDDSPAEPKAKPNPRTKLTQRDLQTDYDIPPDLAAEFLQIRKDKRLTLTPTAMRTLRNEFAKADLSVTAGIRLCCERSWAGFKASWNWQDNGEEQHGITHQRSNGKPKLSTSERFWQRYGPEVSSAG